MGNKATIVKKIHGRLDWTSQVGYVTLNLFLKTEMQNHAAAVAYYFLLSIMPLILLIIFFFNSYMTGEHEIYSRFYSLLSSLSMKFDLDPLKNLSNASTAGHLTGGVSIITLLWSTMGLMESIQNSFGVIFSDSEKRSMISGWAVSLLIIPVSLALVLLTISGGYLSDQVAAYAQARPLAGDFLTTGFGFVSDLTFPALIWLLVFSAYFRLPGKKPRLRSTVLASFLCTLSFLALKLIFSHVLHIEKYKEIYGSIGSIIFILIWVYLVCVIFFLWAEFLYVSGKIDIIALEKIFISSRHAKNSFSAKIENFLFHRSARLFEKYGSFHRNGDVITKQNDDSRVIYFLYSGSLSFHREIDGKLTRLSSIPEGEIFGEMAYLLGERRTGTVIAEGECFLFILSPELFESLLSHSTTLSRRIIKSLCQRLAK